MKKSTDSRVISWQVGVMSSGVYSIEPLECRRLLSGPLVITSGGTYTGTFESTDPLIPAIRIQTTQPVVIANSIVRGPGDLIVSTIDHANVTVRQTAGFGRNPNIAGRSAGHFFNAETFDNVRLENNYLEGTRGINLLTYTGDRTANETIKILRNRVKNIDGRISDGAGGWRDFNTRTRLSDGQRENGFRISQFVQLDKVRALPGIEIAFNDVVNEPGQSRVEDVISLYKSSGTPASPISIHDNYVQGAYTIKPWASDETIDGWYYDWSFSGGGIMLGDGHDEDDATSDSAYVTAFDNTVVDTTNYGIALAAGHNLLARDNRIVSAGTLTDGREISQQNVGLYIWDSYGQGDARFHDNSATGNLIGWDVGDGDRNDWWIPDAAGFTGNTHWPGAVTHATHAQERARWEAANADVGPRGSLEGTVFRDPDGDGIRAAGDGAATGHLLYLDLNGDGVRTDDEPMSRTSSTGRYRFDNVGPGSHLVRLAPTEGWRASKGGFARLSTVAGGVATRYFAVTTLPLITGTVYYDANSDGGFGAKEKGLSGWQLWADLDRDGLFDPDEPASTTNRFGRYAISVPSIGRFEVRVVAQTGLRLTSPGAGYRGVTLSVGEVALARNFGQVQA